MTNQKKHTNIYLLLPIISGVCWGTAGIFVRSLDALKASMVGDNKTIILSEDSPIAQIFNGR